MGAATSRSRITFLQLPREIRDMIYTYAVTEETRMQPAAPLICYHKVGSGNLNRSGVSAHRHRLKDAPCYNQDEFWRIRPAKFKPRINRSLFRTCKQINWEAAEMLFSNREFVFVLAMVNGSYVMRCGFYPSKRPPGNPYQTGAGVMNDDWALMNNLCTVPARHLPLIQRIQLYVHIPMSDGSNRELFQRYKSQLRDFAHHFEGCNHSLQSLQVFLNNPSGILLSPKSSYTNVDHDYDAAQDPEIERYENVLEPLGTIHNIQDPQFSGPTPGFVAKMARAMKSDVLLCVPKPQVYGTRVVKTKGGKKAQKFESDRHYDAKYDFH